MKQFKNISQKEIKTKGVKSLPDRPNAYSRYGSGAMTADQLKDAFDALAELIAERLNSLFDSFADGSFTDAVRLPDVAHNKLNGVTLHTFLNYFATGDVADRIYVKSPFNTGVRTLRACLDEMLSYGNKTYVSKVEIKNVNGTYRLILDSKNGYGLGSVELKVSEKNLDYGVKEYIACEIKQNGEATLEKAQNYTDSECAELDEKIQELKAHTVASLSYDAVTGVLSLTPVEGEAISIDLPLELTVQRGYYDSITHELVIVLTSGDEVRISSSELLNEIVGMPACDCDDAGKIPVASGENLYSLRTPICDFVTEGLTFELLDDCSMSCFAASELKGKVVIPNEYLGKKIIWLPTGAFINQKEITDIYIPDSVNSISLFAFSGCSSLERIKLPAEVDFITYGLFSGCTALTDVVIGYDGGVATLAESMVFDGTTAIIHVPKRWLDEYKTDSNWCTYYSAGRIVGYETLTSLRADIDNIDTCACGDSLERIQALENKCSILQAKTEACEAADVDLQGRISSLETTDGEHYNHLVNLYTAIGNLQTCDSSLQQAIVNEQSARAAMDSYFQDQINVINARLNAFVNASEVGM